MLPLALTEEAGMKTPRLIRRWLRPVTPASTLPGRTSISPPAVWDEADVDIGLHRPSLESSKDRLLPDLTIFHLIQRLPQVVFVGADGGVVGREADRKRTRVGPGSSKGHEQLSRFERFHGHTRGAAARS